MAVIKKKRHTEIESELRDSDKWMKVPLARVLIENKTTKMNNKTQTHTHLSNYTVIHVVLLV